MYGAGGLSLRISKKHAFSCKGKALFFVDKRSHLRYNVRDFCDTEATAMGAGERVFWKGMRDGIPIGLGYFAVAFTLGIYARNVGLTAVQATVSSLLTHASAGQYAGFSMIGRQAAMAEVVLMTLVINARYLLMSTALSQRLGEDTSFLQRLALGYCVTDEIFGISLAYGRRLDPVYTYGAFSVASPGWALGTLLGVLLGNVLPANVVSALSVGLYGMFIAIIMPPARKNRVLAGVILISMGCSFLCDRLLTSVSEGMRTILLTVVIAGGAAALFPVKEDAHE